MKTSKGVLWLVGLMAVVPLARPVSACSIPVYAYAVESWSPDTYDVLVFHRGALAEAQQMLVDSLEHAASDKFTQLNATVRLVNLNSPLDEDLASLWEPQGRPALPWMIVRQPVVWARAISAWSGPLNEQAAERVIDSPIRREIVRRITAGDAAVWILLESGDETADASAFALLEQQLAGWTHAVEHHLPAGVPAAQVDDSEVSAYAGKPAHFSIVRLSRNDPAETLLINTLLNSEDDLRTYSAPMAFPVFGRGRILYALVGSGINAQNITEACAYLVEACSCWVKAENPGSDLLMRAHWEAAIPYADEPSLQAAAMKGDGTPGSPAPLAPATTGPTCPLLCNSLLGLAGGIAIVAFVAWILAGKTRKDRSSSC